MHKTAYREKIRFNKYSFRTEGIEPLDWTYMDGKYIENIHNIFKMVIYLNLTILYIDLVKYKIFSGIKTVLPPNYIKNF